MPNDSTINPQVPPDNLSPPPKQPRKEHRSPVEATTFIKRLASEDGGIIRVTITDVSQRGFGFISFVPFRVGERLAVGLIIPNSPPEIFLARVQHCSRTAAGQYRFGVHILERQPGDIVKNRVPQNWFDNPT